jgi:hypothetical protein
VRFLTKTFFQERYLRGVSLGEWRVIREDRTLDDQYREWAEGRSLQSLTISPPSIHRFWIDEPNRIMLTTHALTIVYWSDDAETEDVVGMEPPSG